MECFSSYRFQSQHFKSFIQCFIKISSTSSMFSAPNITPAYAKTTIAFSSDTMKNQEEIVEAVTLAFTTNWTLDEDDVTYNMFWILGL